MLRRRFVAVQRQVVHRGKRAGYADVLRTDLRAIVAGGAGNDRDFRQRRPRLFDGFLLRRRELLEILHIGEIILHLLNAGHAGKHRDQTVEVRGEPHGPRRAGRFRLRRFQDFLYAFRRIRQHAALDRLHDDDGLVVFPRRFVTGPGLNGRIFPVAVIDLELYELHFRVRLQNGFQFLRRGMERETDMTDLAFLLLFLHEGPHIEVVEKFRAALAEIVQQIEIEIARARLFQRSLELCGGVFPRLAVDPGRVLRGELEFLPRITLHESLPDGVLAARIGPCRIEIREARREEFVHHDLHLLQVDGAVLLRQPHQPKAQLPDVLSQVHENPSCGFFIYRIFSHQREKVCPFSPMRTVSPIIGVSHS